MKISEEILKGNGYKKYNNSSKEINDFDSAKYIGSYQKLIMDEKGKKYFINIDVYEFLTLPIKTSFSSEVQFNKGDNVFDVHFHIDKKTTIEHVEKFFENVWKKMKCDYYNM